MSLRVLVLFFFHGYVYRILTLIEYTSLFLWLSGLQHVFAIGYGLTFTSTELSIEGNYSILDAM